MFSQWALKRVYKFVLKRLLGRVLRNEIDLQQLDVQLGAGTVELKKLYLNTDYLNEQLKCPGIAVTSGYVGTVRATVPWKSLTSQSCVVELHDVEIVLKPQQKPEWTPRSPGQTRDSSDGSMERDGSFGDMEEDGHGPGRNNEAFPESSYDSASDRGGGTTAAYLGVEDGVRGIARLVEKILLGLKVKVVGLVVRLEVTLPLFPSQPTKDGNLGPCEGRQTCMLVMRVSSLDYGNKADGRTDEGLQRGYDSVSNSDGLRREYLVSKCVSFTGMVLELVDGANTASRSSHQFMDLAESHQADSVVMNKGIGAAANNLWEKGQHGRNKFAKDFMHRDFNLSKEQHSAGKRLKDDLLQSSVHEDRRFLVRGTEGATSGILLVNMPWREGRGVQMSNVSMDLSLNPLSVDLHPQDVRLLLRLFAVCCQPVDCDSRCSSDERDKDVTNSCPMPSQLRNSVLQPSESCYSESNCESLHSPCMGVRGRGKLYSYTGDSRRVGGGLQIGFQKGLDKQKGVPEAGNQRSGILSSSLNTFRFQTDEDSTGAETEFLPVSHFIPNWMHWAGDDGEGEDEVAQEADLAASVDEFFDCLDNSLGSSSSVCGSGLWTWTCSALSAITATSNLAAGATAALPVPAVSAHISATVRLVLVTVRLFYEDEVKPDYQSSPEVHCDTTRNVNSVHHMAKTVEEDILYRSFHDCIPPLTGSHSYFMDDGGTFKFGTEALTIDGSEDNGNEWAFVESRHPGNNLRYHGSEYVYSGSEVELDNGREPSIPACLLEETEEELEEGKRTRGYLEVLVKQTVISLITSDHQTVTEVTVMVAELAEQVPSNLPSLPTFNDLSEQVMNALPSGYRSIDPCSAKLGGMERRRYLDFGSLTSPTKNTDTNKTVHFQDVTAIRATISWLPPRQTSSNAWTRGREEGKGTLDITISLLPATLWLDLDVISRVQPMIAGWTYGLGTLGAHFKQTSGYRNGEETSCWQHGAAKQEIGVDVRNGEAETGQGRPIDELRVYVQCEFLRIGLCYGLSEDDKVVDRNNKVSLDVKFCTNSFPQQCCFIVVDVRGLTQNSGRASSFRSGACGEGQQSLIFFEQLSQKEVEGVVGALVPSSKDRLSVSLARVDAFLLSARDTQKGVDSQTQCDPFFGLPCRIFSLTAKESKGASTELQSTSIRNVATGRRSDMPDFSAVSVEILSSQRAKTGTWLLREAWDATMAQRKRADGGSGVGGGHGSDFAAAAVSEAGVEDLHACEVREQMMASSPIQAAVKVGHVVVSVSAEQVRLLMKVFRCLDYVLKQFTDPGLLQETCPRAPFEDIRQVSGPLKGEEGLQAACHFSCVSLEIVVHLGASEPGSNIHGKENNKLDKDNDRPVWQKRPDWGRGWKHVRLRLENTSAFHAVAVGGVPDSQYSWLQHQDCQIYVAGPDVNISPETQMGTSSRGVYAHNFPDSCSFDCPCAHVGTSGLYNTAQETETPGMAGSSWSGERCDAFSDTGGHEGEWLAFECSRASLGRGDGGVGEGNALADALVGSTVTYVAWPGGGRSSDAVIAVSLRGGTLIGKGGRFDWLQALQEFVEDVKGESVDMEESREKVSEEKRGASDISGVKAERMESKLEEIIVVSSMYLLLDVYDSAVVYEPGPEALDTSTTSANCTFADCRLAPDGAAVACVMAASAIRLASDISIGPKPTAACTIWLRDAAGSIVDIGVRSSRTVPRGVYTRAILQQAGFVQVARAAVMEAHVSMVEGESPPLVVSCTNCLIRFETCRDTTAAIGRLASQLSQLLASDVVPTRPPATATAIPLGGGEIWSVSPASVDDVVKRSCGGQSEGQMTSSCQGNEANQEVSSVGAGHALQEDRNVYIAGSCNTVIQRVLAGLSEDAFVSPRRGDQPPMKNKNVQQQGGFGNTEALSSSGGCDTTDVEAEISEENLSNMMSSGMSSNPGVNTLTSALFSNSAFQSNDGVHESFHRKDLRADMASCSMPKLPVVIEDFYKSGCRYMEERANQAVLQESEGEQRPIGRKRQAGRVQIHSGWYEGQAANVRENHVPEPKNADFDGDRQAGASMPDVDPLSEGRKGDRRSRGGKSLSLSKRYPPSIRRVHMKEVSVRWRLYGGNDWPINTGGEAIRTGISGNSNRQTDMCMEVVLEGMEIQQDTFGPGRVYASRLAVSVRDVGVYDRSRDAPWRLVMGYHRSKALPREASARAVRVLMDAVRPDPSAIFEEYRLTLALFPVRLHLEQRHLDFVTLFFIPPEGVSGTPSQGKGGSSTVGLPVPVAVLTAQDLEAAAEAEALLPFFQICEMRPLSIRVDYTPTRVDLTALRGGDYAQLANLVCWKEVDVELKGVRAKGVHGWGSLGGTVAGEWLEDISHRQLHKFVQGVGPISPLYALGVGVAQLFVLPVEHYRRDRRLLKGMRKGAAAFLKSVSLEALGVGAHLAGGAQDLLQHTEAVLGGFPRQTTPPISTPGTEDIVRQPGGPKEGLKQAYESLSLGLQRSASGLVGNPVKAYQRGAGAGKAVGKALRAAPAALVAPASAAAGAVQRALLGVRNRIVGMAALTKAGYGYESNPCLT